MLDLVDRHQQALTRRVLATFASAWHGTDGTVQSTEALIAEALRASPQDEGLLRLRAWSLSWGPLRTSPALLAHHLHRWLDAAGRPAGAFALERLRADQPEAHEAPLLMAVMPNLPAPAIQGVLKHLLDQPPVWLPLQTLLLNVPVRQPDLPGPRNAWNGTVALWSQVGSADLAHWTWVNTVGEPDPVQLGRAGWWMTMAGLNNEAQRQVMRAYQQAMDRPWDQDLDAPEARQQRRDDALMLGLRTAHDHAALNSIPGTLAALPAWLRDATEWLHRDARLPHHRRFDLPRSSTLPWEGQGFPEEGTYDDAVTWVRESPLRVTIERDLWFVLWEALEGVERRCVERRQLRETLHAVLDEQGVPTEELKTRPRL